MDAPTSFGFTSTAIINYRDGIMDKLQYFTFTTEFMLITFFWETLSKSYTDFDSYNMYLVGFAVTSH